MAGIDYGPILTVTAILVALLALWAQSWPRSTQCQVDAQTNERIQASATLGTFWIYTAFVIAFVALGLLVAGKYWEGGGMDWAAEIGLGFFITTFLMAFINVVESTLNMFRRVLRGAKTPPPLRGLDPNRLTNTLWWRIITIVVLTLIISSLGVALNHWFWMGLLLVGGFGLRIYLNLTKP